IYERLTSTSSHAIDIAREKQYSSLLSIGIGADGRMIAWTSLAQHRHAEENLGLVLIGANGRMIAWISLARHRNNTNTLSLVQNKHSVLTFMVVAQVWDLSGIVSSWNYLRSWCNTYLSALHKDSTS
ncbi:hypothetical protein MKW98_007140, partial [Papaver atlanticum]